MSDEEKQPTDKQEKTKEKHPEPITDKPTPDTPVEKSPEKTETPQADQPTKQEKTPEPKKPQESTEPPTKEKQPEKPKQETKETKEPTKSTPPPATKEEKPDTPPKKPDQPTEKKDKKKTKKDKDDKPDDFQYIVRIANTDINGDYPLELGLSQITGIGRRLACIIADHAGIKRSFKMGNLSDKQIEKIRETLTKIDEIAPTWMLNHQKDFDTGEDQHIISAQVELRLRDDVNLLKMIRSYRGIRHESRLPVRGQRTRANNRTGLTLGVSKKKQ